MMGSNPEGPRLREQAGGECANVRVAVDGPSRRHALALRPGHVAALTGLQAVPAAADGSDLGSGPAAAASLPAAALPDGEPMDVDDPARQYEWREVCTLSRRDPNCALTSRLHTAVSWVLTQADNASVHLAWVMLQLLCVLRCHGSHKQVCSAHRASSTRSCANKV